MPFIESLTDRTPLFAADAGAGAVANSGVRSVRLSMNGIRPTEHC